MKKKVYSPPPVKYRLSDNDLTCENYKVLTKEGQLLPCNCHMKEKGFKKNIRMHFKVTKEKE